MRKSNLKRNKKNKENLSQLIPEKTILQSSGNLNLIWVWTGETSRNTPYEVLEIKIIGYTQRASMNHKDLAKKCFIHNSSVPYNDHNLTVASKEVIKNIVWVHPEYKKNFQKL